MIYLPLMFSGIVHSTGLLSDIIKTSDGMRIEVSSPQYSKRMKVGQSVAIDGVCLTITGKKSSRIHFDIVAETLQSTHFLYKKMGDRVNLETSVKPIDLLDGHIVLGHVDGVGIVKKIINIGNQNGLTISFPNCLRKYFTQKGSVAVNGVSLTIQHLKDSVFTIALIPYTQKHTNLGLVKVGDHVNLEVDVLARYLEQLLRNS